MQKALTQSQIVDQQLVSYNNNDIDIFMSFFSDDIQFYNFSDRSLISEGLDDCRKMYQNIFTNSPNLHCEILNRIAIGTRVIDHEQVTGRVGVSDPYEVVMIYDFNKENKIYKMTALRKKEYL